MKLIGLTGGLGSGKSTVSSMLKDQGLDVLDADIFAREVVRPGSFGLWSLAQVFGTGILKGEELDRAVLAEKLFSDAKIRDQVERILHPLIQWRARGEFAALRAQHIPLAFYDAALIFEKNMMSLFDGVVVVHCPLGVQLQRLMDRDKISKDVAEKRLAAQWPLEQKIAAAQFLIDNSGTKEETKKQVLDLVRKLQTENDER